MRRVAAEFARNVVQWVYPNTCLVCDSPESDTVVFRHGLCIDCHAAITTEQARSMSVVCANSRTAHQHLARLR